LCRTLDLCTVEENAGAERPALEPERTAAGRRSRILTHSFAARGIKARCGEAFLAVAATAREGRMRAARRAYSHVKSARLMTKPGVTCMFPRRSNIERGPRSARPSVARAMAESGGVGALGGILLG
jgi:hypothetical protein